MEQTNQQPKKRKSLTTIFTAIFIFFAMVTILANGGLTYYKETKSYQRTSVENLRHITENISRMIVEERDEFLSLKSWFVQYSDEVQIPLDFRADLPRAEKAFYGYLEENHAQKVFGKSLTFSDLSHEGQRLYVIYRFEHWFKIFFDAVDDFNLSYVYFIYPELDKDHVMNYMFDPTLVTEKNEKGEDILLLGDQVYEDPNIHANMWKVWESGEAGEAFDTLDNEFGFVYTYCYPVKYDEEKVGLLCAEISVDKVNADILQATIQQMVISVIILFLCTLFLFDFIRRMVLRRIARLEKDVTVYSETKDIALAAEIEGHCGDYDEIGSLGEKFSLMITELDHYMDNLQKVTAEKERIGAELSIATQIQADMLPRIFPIFPDRTEFDLYATMTPAKEVGGDFYDIFMVDHDHLAMVIADVSGKGVPAALFMVIAKTLIKNRVQLGESPSKALANVNNQLCEGNEAELFVTVWLGILDIQTGDVVEANAGHEYPAIRRSNGTYELLRLKHSPAVATFEGLRFREDVFHIEPGDSIFVYTDGVTEATNEQNELFGEERMLAVLNDHASAHPGEILPVLKKAIDDFVGEAPQFDDITMLAFEYIGPNKD